MSLAHKLAFEEACTNKEKQSFYQFYFQKMLRIYNYECESWPARLM